MRPVCLPTYAYIEHFILGRPTAVQKKAIEEYVAVVNG
jgi:hypothetical protein